MSARMSASSSVSRRPSASLIGCGRDAEMARPLHQQFADDQRARGLLPGRDRLCRRMMLHFAHDRVAGDGHAVHADGHRLSSRNLRVGRASCHRTYSAGSSARVRRVRTT